MFSQLKQGSQLYILHGNVATPFVEVGIVENQVNAMQMAYYPSMPTFPLDFTVRVGERMIPLRRIPANAESATVVAEDGESITIACTKEAINNEVDLQQQKSIEAVNSVDFHKSRIMAFDNLRKQLNPEIAEKVAQQEEINSLKTQMADITKNIGDLVKQNNELMAELKAERASKK